MPHPYTDAQMYTFTHTHTHMYEYLQIVARLQSSFRTTHAHKDIYVRVWVHTSTGA